MKIFSSTYLSAVDFDIEISIREGKKGNNIFVNWLTTANNYLADYFDGKLNKILF